MEKTYETQVEAYRKYIDKHIANVQKAFNEYGQELCKRLKIDYRRLATCVSDHDKSKYSEEEFEGYRRWYYPTDEEEKDKNDPSLYYKEYYDQAWLHHLKNNAHHPEFWIRTTDDGFDYIDMDKYAIAEMLLDWTAMSYKGGDSTYDYYNNNITSKPFSANTISIIDSVIDIFK